MAADAATAVGLEIYGGDAIVTPTGRLVLVDLNDWPSFARCRRAAAAGITRYVESILAGMTEAAAPSCGWR